MNKNIETCQPAPMVHGRMIYRCQQCGRSWSMFLEKGIEEFGENHKPSPFTICCPYCGGWAMDVSGILKIPGGGYMPLPNGASYFANMENHDCGVPTHSIEAVEEEAAKTITGQIVEELERQLDEEMERVISAAISSAEEARAVKKTAIILAKKTGVSLEEAAAIAMKAILDFGTRMKEALDPFLGEPDPAALEPGEPLDIPTAWDRKEAREKRRAVERAAASRFRQYRARESAWAAQKRTGPRRREWRGPWKES